MRLQELGKGLFRVVLCKQGREIGFIELEDLNLRVPSVELDITICQAARGRWFGRQVAKELKQLIVKEIGLRGYELIYSTAHSVVSAKLLKFFGFLEYEPAQYVCQVSKNDLTKYWSINGT